MRQLFPFECTFSSFSSSSSSFPSPPSGPEGEKTSCPLLPPPLNVYIFDSEGGRKGGEMWKEERRRRRREGNFSTPIFLPLLGQEKKKSRKWVLWKRKEDDGQLCFSFSGSEKSFSLPPVLFARSRKREKVKVMLILFIKHLTVITPLSFSSPLALCALSFPRKTISGPSPPLRPTHLGPGRGCRKKEGGGDLEKQKREGEREGK